MAAPLLLEVLRGIGHSCGLKRLPTKPPKIRTVHLDESYLGFYYSEPKRIDLSFEVCLHRKPPLEFRQEPGTFSLAVLTHELIHHLLVHYKDEEEIAHGPMFQEIARIIGFKKPYENIAITRHLADNLLIIHQVVLKRLEK